MEVVLQVLGCQVNRNVINFRIVLMFFFFSFLKTHLYRSSLLKNLSRHFIVFFFYLRFKNEWIFLHSVSQSVKLVIYLFNSLFRFVFFFSLLHFVCINLVIWRNKCFFVTWTKRRMELNWTATKSWIRRTSALDLSDSRDTIFSPG